MDNRDIEFLRIKAEIDKMSEETKQLKRNNSRLNISLKWFVAIIAIIGYIIFIVDPTIKYINLDKELKILEINKRQDSVNESIKFLLSANDSITKVNKQNSNTLASLRSDFDSLSYLNYNLYDSIALLKIALIKINTKLNPEEIEIQTKQIISNKDKEKEKTITRNINADSSISNLTKQIAISEGNTNTGKFKEYIGWMYAGHFINNIWGGTNTLKIGNQLPEKGKEYELVKDTWLREGYPKGLFYKMQEEIVVLRSKTKVKIIGIEPDIGRNKVWVQIKTIN